MDVRNCRRCRRLFNYLGGKNICPECVDELETAFVKVKDYIRENPSNTLQEVADANDVDVNQIKEWMKEGRLELTKGSAITLNCEKCGAAILKGRYCAKCSDKMTKSINELVGNKPALDLGGDDDPRGPKMRFRK